MIYSHSLLNKPVIDADRNEKIGIVKGYVIDPDGKRVSAFILAPGSGQTSLDVIPFPHVKSVFENAIITVGPAATVKMSDAPEIMEHFMKDVSVIGEQVLTDTGMLAGVVRDFAFSEEDGSICRLVLHPENARVDLVDGHHILTITPVRLMISGLALTETIDIGDEPPPPRHVPEEEPREKPSPESEKRNPSPPSGEKPPRPREKARKAPPPPPEPEVEPEEDFETEQPYASIGGRKPEFTGYAPPDLPTTRDIREMLGDMFREMTDILTARLNVLDSAAAFDRVRDDLLNEIRDSLKKEHDDLPTLEILVEDKIKKGAGRPLAQVAETLGNIEETVAQLRKKAEENKRPKAVVDLAPVTEALSEIRKELKDVSGAVAAMPPQETIDTDALVEKISESISGPLSELENTLSSAIQDAAPNMENDLKMLKDTVAEPITEQLHNIEEKMIAGILELTQREEYDPKRLAEEASGKLLEAIQGIGEKVPDAAEFRDGIQEIKKLLEERDGAVRELLRETTGKLEETLGAESLKHNQEKLLGEFRSLQDRMATDNLELLSEQQDHLRQLTSETETKLAGRIEALKGRLEEIAAGMASSRDNVREDIAAEIEKLVAKTSDLFESRIAEQADTDKKTASEISGLVQRVENRLVEVREQHSAAREQTEEIKNSLLDEIRSFSGSVVKPEDLMIIRQWLGEIKPGDDPELRKSIADISASIDSVRKQLSDAREQIAAVRDAANAITETVTDRMDMASETLSGRFEQDLESIRNIETVTRHALDGFRKDLGETIRENTGALSGDIEKKIDQLIRDRMDRLEKISGDSSRSLEDMKENIRELLEEATSAPYETLRDIRGEFAGQVVGLGTKMVQEWDRKIEEQMEEQADFIKSNVLKPEDLVTIRQWVDELQSSLRRDEGVVDDVSEAIDFLKTGVMDNRQELAGLRESISGIKDSIESRIDKISSSVSSSIDGMAAASAAETVTPAQLDELKSEVASGLAELRQSLSKGLESSAEKYSTMLGETVSAIKSDLENLLSKLPETGENFDRLREELSGTTSQLAEKLSAEWEKKIEARLSDHDRKLESSRKNMETAVHQLRDGLKESLESGMQGMASIQDVEQMRHNVEERVGEVTDRFVERIEAHLDERDHDIEKGIQNILKKVEKLMQRGARSDIEGLFSGGGLFGGLFGGGGQQQSGASSVKIPSRTSRGAARGSYAGSASIEDNQIKRLAYLIGKKLRQDVADQQGNVLAREGETVDEDMIRRLRDAHCTLPLIRSVDFGD